MPCSLFLPTNRYRYPKLSQPYYPKSRLKLGKTEMCLFNRERYGFSQLPGFVLSKFFLFVRSSLVTKLLAGRSHWVHCVLLRQPHELSALVTGFTECDECCRDHRQTCPSSAETEKLVHSSNMCNQR